ncbi:hypothetical protein [Chelatococcus reniformis]|uniref:Uncharacterized protein n=1 Tax=Chelatococcus reniformis TaxID=1494448 RepID=A0A916TZS2_9HYPH|nr:hypothetical protein [Chelatococcus reniformis]GGC52105.1 hypothetical protein GCM10010994_09050 [Chelatococcus reniformis]
MDAAAALVARLAAAGFLVDVQAPGRPIAHINDAFARFTGLAAGRPLAAVLGPHANARDRARLEALVAAGEAFAMTVSGARPDGAIWRAAMQMTPVTGDRGEPRWLGILVPAERSEAPAVAQLRHGYQNIMQTMTSLVSLHARHAPEPATAAAMRDLAARCEALAGLYGPADSAPGELIDLGDFLHGLADRVAAVCDPGHHRPIKLTADAVLTARRTAAVVGQLLAELMIVICGERRAGPIGMTLRAHGGDAELVVRAGLPDRHDDAGAERRLGGTLTRALVRGLSGRLSEEAADDGGRSWRLTWPIL